MKISRYIASYWNIVKYRLYHKKTVLLRGGQETSKTVHWPSFHCQGCQAEGLQPCGEEQDEWTSAEKPGWTFWRYCWGAADMGNSLPCGTEGDWWLFVLLLRAKGVLKVNELSSSDIIDTLFPSREHTWCRCTLKKSWTCRRWVGGLGKNMEKRPETPLTAKAVMCCINLFGRFCAAVVKLIMLLSTSSFPIYLMTNCQ